MMDLLTVQQACFAYKKKRILNEVTVSFAHGGVISLLGPNGSGKTTLLKIMLGLLQPDSGTILFEGQPLTTIPHRQLARRIAYVPQVHRESFPYTVEDVVLMGRMPYHSFFSTYSQADRDIARASMKKLEILHLRARPYTEISGGERQLALIGRSLAQGAELFIMDEPVNGLDYGNQIRLLQRIKELAEDGLTFIMTTHFPDHALMTANRAILLKDGTVVADGPTDETITPQVLGELYRIDVDIVSMNGNGRVCVPIWANQHS
ncbi:MAG: ABC transporter ATP-binding protein [Desulfopila sp.]